MGAEYISHAEYNMCHLVLDSWPRNPEVQKAGRPETRDEKLRSPVALKPKSPETEKTRNSEARKPRNSETPKTTGNPEPQTREARRLFLATL